MNQGQNVSDDFIDRVKIFKLDTNTQKVVFEVWEKNRQTRVPEMVETGEIRGIDRIPILAAYSNRVDFYFGLPVLMELAEVQIQHWQSTADQNNILRIIRVPMLQIKGHNEKFNENGEVINQIVISPNSTLNFDAGSDAGAEWIEHKGNSIDAGRDHLKDLEEHMSFLGTELSLPRSPQPQSATGELIDESEANSLLKDIANSFFDTIEEALVLAARYMKLDPETSIGVLDANRDVKSFKGIQDLQHLIELYKNGIISRELTLKEAIRRDVISTEIDIEDELNKTEQPKQNNTGE
jgi:hypothetical protein